MLNVVFIDWTLMVNRVTVSVIVPVDAGVLHFFQKQASLPNKTHQSCFRIHLSSEAFEETVQQHLLVQDLKQGVVQEKSFPSSALYKLVNDDGNDQVEHNEVDAKNKGDTVDG